MSASSPIRARSLRDVMFGRNILVTGFEPFGGETVNASWEAARELDGWRCGHYVANARLLHCAYHACIDEFVDAFEALRPDAVILTGQAASRAVICVERIARNEASATRPDNLGVVGGARPPDAGPEWLETTAPAAGIARAIRNVGLPARVSTNAGDYVCNHLYYGVLKYLMKAPNASPAVFLHLPATPDQTTPRANARRLATANAARALRAAAAAMAEASMTGKQLANSARISD